MTRFKLMMSVLMLFCALFSSEAFSQSKALRFNAVSSGWPPYAFLDADQQPTGILVEALPLFLKGKNISLEISNFPLLRAEKGMLDGQVDVMIRSKSWTKDPENYYWSNSIIHNRDIILSRKDSPIEFAKISDLTDLKIGTIHGFKYPTLDAYFQNKKLERIDALNTANSIQMLTHKHVQGIVISEAVAKWLIKNDPTLQGQFYFSHNAIDQNSIEFRFRKDPKLLPIIDEVNQGLLRCTKNGDFEKLIKTYQ